MGIRNLLGDLAKEAMKTKVRNEGFEEGKKGLPVNPSVLKGELYDAYMEGYKIGRENYMQSLGSRF